MNFRDYCAARVAHDMLAEADLLGTPSSGSPAEPSKKPSPPEPNKSGESEKAGDGPSSSPNSSGRSPGDSNDQLQQAAALTGQLVRLLARLPHPWNKQFYAFLHPLQALQGRLQEIS